jgi:hypothetical protein
MADLNLSTLTEADIITKRVMPAILMLAGTNANPTGGQTPGW